MRRTERIRRFIDGELEPREETEFLLEAQRDPELHDALQAELDLREGLRTLRERTSDPPPTDFTERMMVELRQRMPERPPPRWHDWLFRPMPVRLRLSPVAWLLPIVAVVLIALLAYRIGQLEAGVQPPGLESAPIAELTLGAPAELPVRFMLHAAGAKTVTVVGDFNGWSPERNELEDHDGDGVFVGTVRIAPGSYAYMFVVDGQRWVLDPNATNVREDDFGQRNAILRID